MSNINRDYLIILDVKSGEVDSPNIYYFNTDINTAGSNRVISTGTISTYSVTNYTANIANYINSLSSVIITPAQSTSYDNNINIYEVWIDVDYSDASSKLQNMYVGGNKINGIYLGSTKVNRVYIGTNLVY